MAKRSGVFVSTIVSTSEVCFDELDYLFGDGVVGLVDAATEDAALDLSLEIRLCASTAPEFLAMNLTFTITLPFPTPHSGPVSHRIPRLPGLY